LQIAAAGVFLALCTTAAMAQGPQTDPIQGVNLEQRLDAQVPVDAVFQDEHGKSVRMGDYFGKRPIVLNLIFYRCPGTCSVELEGMVDCFRKMDMSVGKQFDVVTISINPKETPALATDKKEALLEMYGRKTAQAGWHFLVGDDVNIHRVADSIGYSYKYNPNSPNVQGMFAHPAGIILLTPHGKVSRYFFTTMYRPKDVSLGLVEASNNKIGSLVERFVLRTCLYQYNPYTGRYGVQIFRLIQLSGFATVLIVGSGISMMLIKERRTARTIKKTILPDVKDETV
jgi:protein SCO1/2